MSEPLPRGTQVKDLDPDAFYTPEQIAPVVGFKVTELRRYCRESGLCTRLTRQKITLDLSNIKALITWVKSKNAEPVINDDGEIDHFA